MIPTLVQLGPFPIHSFGLMMVCALFAAYRRLALSFEKVGASPALAERLTFWAGLGGIIGARLAYVFTYYDQFLEDPLGAVFSGAGFIFYGGFFGGMAAVTYILRKEGKSFLWCADLVGPALAIGYAVGRIGCQLSGDGDYGRESSLPWAMSYLLGVVPTKLGLRVHPAPVYETLAALLIAWLVLKADSGGRWKKPGALFGLYLVLSGIERFLVEIIRIEPRVIGAISQAQVVSLFLIAVGFAFIARRNRSSLRAAP